MTATSESTYALYQLGRWDEALEAFAQLPVELLPSGLALISPLTAILPIHLYRGELERARELCDIYAPLASSIDVQERSCYDAGHATLALAEGRYEDALAEAGAAVATQGLVGAWPQNVKLGLITAVEAALALGLRDRVDELLAAPESEPAGLRTPLIAAHAHRFRGRMAGSAESAAAEFAEAERILRDLDIRFWLAVSQLEHAEALIAHGGEGDVRGLTEAARETFVALGAKPWIDRAETVLAPALQPDAAS